MSQASLVLSPQEIVAADRLIVASIEEDLRDRADLTTEALVPPQARGRVRIVARQPGMLCGMTIASRVFAAIDPRLQVRSMIQEGQPLAARSVVAEVSGPVDSLLTAERTALNFLTLLSGVASLTRRYVEAVKGTRAKILDTRKTLPGLRLLQKFAVRCGGGENHRIGLYDAVLIKDNHLAWWREDSQGTLGDAVRTARKSAPGVIIEIEVDRLDQLRQVLPAIPDIVLLDNMPPDQLRDCVSLRDKLAPGVLLEASGGVNLDTVREIALTGVDRISVGALTHSAPALDLAFDWPVAEDSGASI